jgi:hypothetical protein
MRFCAAVRWERIWELSLQHVLVVYGDLILGGRGGSEWFRGSEPLLVSVCTRIQCELLILLAVQNVPKGVGQRGRGKVPIFFFGVCGGECLIGRYEERVAFDYWNNAAVTV